MRDRQAPHSIVKLDSPRTDLAVAGRLSSLNEEETIGGVPLGLSRDYAHLPRTGPLREICCQTCDKLYEDVERLTADGQRVLAVMCGTCREEGRLRWIAKKVVPLPTASVTFRRGKP